MSLTITIGDAGLARRLQGEARKRGLSSSELAVKLLEQSLPPDGAANVARAPDAATIALLDQWDREDETDDPAESARQEAELRAFMDAINRNRLDSEGPRARKIYP